MTTPVVSPAVRADEEFAAETASPAYVRIIADAEPAGPDHAPLLVLTADLVPRD